MDLSIHKLHSFSELVELRNKDKDRFDRYTNTVYTILQTMTPEESFNVVAKVAESSRPMFIKVVCMAISEGYNLEFSEDFKIVRMLKPIEPIKINTKKDEEVK